MEARMPIGHGLAKQLNASNPPADVKSKITAP
jgi:hypothetical protein